MFSGFEPIFEESSRVLILGSFPSVKSRARGFYYGNKQNRFWKMLENVFAEKIDDNIESKVKFLKKHHIALYDAVKTSDLSGSADQSLTASKFKVADLTPLLPPHTKVQKILCNGKTAFEIVGKNLSVELPVFCMPSTSPANVRYDEKIWQEQLDFLKN